VCHGGAGEWGMPPDNSGGWWLAGEMVAGQGCAEQSMQQQGVFCENEGQNKVLGLVLAIF